MLQDDEIFQVFSKSRELGAIVMVHAENGSVIKELEKEMSKMGITGPEGHLYSRPEKARDEYFDHQLIEHLYFSWKLKRQIELLPLLNKLGNI